MMESAILYVCNACSCWMVGDSPGFCVETEMGINEAL